MLCWAACFREKPGCPEDWSSIRMGASTLSQSRYQIYCTLLTAESRIAGLAAVNFPPTNSTTSESLADWACCGGLGGILLGFAAPRASCLHSLNHCLGFVQRLHRRRL
ncbi:hypothetical protein B0H67DRAFT_363552 [Lasiosphaeris hirsuta]|uniref:Uncharacterized protein n=1 Tax=Lasiosphaeris hirsuta TaxID=260670 RepID=A0AA39ZWD8_9PEZI|nr:hypothetical protein B0H67DRAFT_363552 [Lasiosphaeris hirsuta]